MRKLFYNFLCILFLYHANGFSLEIILPSPTGPYLVGTQAIEIKDPSRQMLRDSGVRRWMIQVFYPTSLSTTQLQSYMPETLDNGIIKSVKVLVHSQPNAPILMQEPLPVIIFIPGLGGERQKYTLLCEELASYGYVVLSFDQPYVSNFVRFPNGDKIVLTLTDAWKIPRDRDYRYQYYDKAMVAAIADITYLLNNFNPFNQTYFKGVLNEKKIVLMGHSFGGNVAHTLGFTDSRIQAIVDIDSKITERKIYGRIGVPPNLFGKPVLFIRGMKQYQEDVGDQLTKIKNATILPLDVQHSAFADTAYLVQKIDAMKSNNDWDRFINWFFKKGPHFDSIDINLGPYSAEEWFNTYRLQIVKWLKTVK